MIPRGATVAAEGPHPLRYGHFRAVLTDAGLVLDGGAAAKLRKIDGSVTEDQSKVPPNEGLKKDVSGRSHAKRTCEKGVGCSGVVPEFYEFTAYP